MSGQVIQTTSAVLTEKAGQALGKKLHRGDVVALHGTLGAGKTTFARGLAKGLGVKDTAQVASPTFVIIHEYQGREKMYHLDWYRLERVTGPDAAFAEECFRTGVTVIEWPERGAGLLPADRYEVHLSHIGHTTRRIEMHRGPAK